MILLMTPDSCSRNKQNGPAQFYNCPSLPLFGVIFWAWIDNCFISKALGKFYNCSTIFIMDSISLLYTRNFLYHLVQSRSEVFLGNELWIRFKGLQHCFKKIISFTFVALADILNLAKIVINFARDIPTTELVRRK